MKYSVKSKSPLALIGPVVAIIAAYAVPLQNWVQIALLGLVIGALTSFILKGQIERSFDPPDAPIADKRKIVAGFAIARLVIGFALIGVSLLLFADGVASGFVAVGGYLAGTTAATPLNERELS